MSRTVDTAAPIYLMKDVHGDTTALLRSNSQVETYDYDEYGNLTDSTGTIDNPYRYCGEYVDSETGFIYLRNRYYDPKLGRFTSEDPAKSGINWYVYCENNPLKFVDPWGLDAIIITAKDAAYGQGHTSILIQDTNDGNWYYFYWGDKAAYYIAVPWQNGAMDSLESFNNWLSSQNLPYNTTGYTSATFIEGYFNASSNYFKNLVANTVIESGYRYEASTYEKPTYKYYVENTSYKLFGKNCLQMTMEGFYKGILKDGSNVGTFMSGELEKTWLAGTRPNTAEPVFNQLFFNRRFTRAAARNDVTWEAKYGAPPEKYKSKGRRYARTLGVI